MAGRRPPVPGSLTINGKPEADDLSLHDYGTITVRAAIRDNPNEGGRVRLVVRWATNKDMVGGGRVVSEWGGSRTESVKINGTARNTHYWIRVYCEQKNLSRLSAENNSNFWTERYPLSPTLTYPPENATTVQGSPLTLTWTHRDADTSPSDPQARAQIQIRVPAGTLNPAGPTTTYQVTGTTASYALPVASLAANTFYEWRVRTSDSHTPTAYGAWSDYRSFFVLGSSLTPILRYPAPSQAVSVDADFAFMWTFRDPTGDNQSKADIRYRVQGTDTWINLTGDVDPGVPGSTQAWVIPANTIAPGYLYEWQVRTYDDSGLGTPSDWSQSSVFYAVLTPGVSNVDHDWFGPTEIQGTLGNGKYRVMVYDRGAQRLVGEIEGVGILRWNRVRDDISNATIASSGFGEDCCALLGSLRCWAHELVLFRDGVRVWEGPITRISYYSDHVEVEARDPMVYVYRRIMRQGYNDNYRVIGGNKSHSHVFNYPGGHPPGYCTCGAIEWGRRTVVDRAAQIIANALAPDDPNVLPWLTRFDFPDDAVQARQVPDWTKSAWEEVDSLAATGGLDYTTAGRRIILWDTHRPIGILAEMRERDFFDSPVLTEYGMSAANIFGVTNNSGIWGSYTVPQSQWADLGPIEMIASEYGEAATAGGGAPESLTPAQQAAKRAILSAQARRNQSGRWPSPMVARIPDNSRIRPDANVGINQLIPGVHIPLRVENLCRSFAQIQKLDSMNVEVINGDEAVRVVMSPAPDAGDDPDASGGDVTA